MNSVYNGYIVYIYIYDYHKWIEYQLVEGLAGFLNHRESIGSLFIGRQSLLVP